MTSNFTPYIKGSHSARRKADAARALLKAAPPGTDLVYEVRDKEFQPHVSSVVRQFVSSKASKELGLRQTTRIEGDKAVGYVYRPATPVANPLRVTSDSTETKIAGAGVTLTVNTTLPADAKKPAKKTARQKAQAKRGRGRPSKYTGNRSYEHKLKRAAEFFAESPTGVFQARQIAFDDHPDKTRDELRSELATYRQGLKANAARRGLPYDVSVNTTNRYIYVEVRQIA